jgi:hypothetical protein
MKTLDLVLKKKWYDMIESGEKTEEYREIKPYWVKRLTSLRYGRLLFSHRNGYQPIPFKDFTHVTFHLGYSKDRPSMTFAIKEIVCGEGNEKWGAEKDKLYFVIKLGEKL